MISHKKKSSAKKIVMIGPSLESKGGISSVVNSYIHAGMFGEMSIEYFQTHESAGNMRKWLVMLSALYRYFIRHLFCQVSVAHIHVARWNSFWRKSLFMLVSLVFGIPYILHIHSGGFPAFFENDCGWLKKRLLVFLLKKSSLVIVLTNDMRSWVLRRIGSDISVKVVPNFLALPKFHFSPQSKVPDSLLFMGRFVEEKGVYVLLEALSRLSRRGINFSLVLAGVDDSATVEPLLEEKGIASCVSIKPWVSGSEKWELLEKTSIFVLPSYVEGLPMGVLEAMASGCTVVATTVGGIPDQIENGVSGVLVEPGNVQALSVALESLLLEPDRASRLSEAAKQVFDARFSACALKGVYRDLYAKYSG